MAKYYELSVHITNEQDIQKLIKTDVMEPAYEKKYTTYLKEHMPSWATIGRTEYIEMFWMSSERRAILNSGLAFCIQQKETE